MRRARAPLAAGCVLATALAALAAGGLASAAGAGELHGQVRLALPGLRLADVGPVVVYLDAAPATAAVAAAARASAQVRQQNARFSPPFLAIARGQSVAMPNDDSIYHNVFSPSGSDAFDLGLYRNGASKSKTFTTPGLVRIYCNIHPQMAAYLLVVDGPHFARADSEGTAVLADVPAGRRPVRVWDERGGDWSGAVDVAAGQTAALSVLLDGSAFRETPHKNKHGRDYPPPGDDDNRY